MKEKFIKLSSMFFVLAVPLLAQESDPFGGGGKAPEKLKKLGDPELIGTVRGVGDRFQD